MVSSSLEATLQVWSGSNPNGELIEPTGSLAIAKGGPSLWMNQGGSTWTNVVDSSLSGTINSAIVNLSGTINAKFESNTGYRGTIWNYPASPHPYDLEFEEDLPDGWIWIGASGSTSGTEIDPYEKFANGACRYDINYRRRSWMMLQPNADGTGYGFYRDVTGEFTGDFFVWFRGSFSSRMSVNPINNDASITFGVMQSVPPSITDRVDVSMNEQDPGTIQFTFDKSQGGTSTSIVGYDYYVSAPAQMNPVEALGIHKVGTKYHAWAFTSNGTSQYMGSHTWTGSINYLWFRVNNAGVSTNPGNMILGVDFIRFITGSKWMP